MKITYLDCTNEDRYIPDAKRRVKDKYFNIDQNKDNIYLYDETLHPYTLEDCVLVRTTDIFPFDHEIHTPASDCAFDYGNSIYLGQAIRDKIKLEHPEFSYEELEEESQKYVVYAENPRETLHFTLNGLVQSHMQGNFDGRKFMIVEPLKYHIDESLLSIRPEDTFFKGNITLSNESTIIISEEVFENIKNDLQYIDDLERFNVFIYKGDNQELAVRQALNILGYDCFIMANRYFVHGNDPDYPAKEMTDFLYNFTSVNGISQQAHNHSDEYKKELEERTKRNKEIDYRHLNFIFENSNLPADFIVLMKEQLSYPALLKENATKLVNIVGLDSLAVLTKKFNETTLKERKEKRSSKEL